MIWNISGSENQNFHDLLECRNRFNRQFNFSFEYLQFLLVFRVVSYHAVQWCLWFSARQHVFHCALVRRDQLSITRLVDELSWFHIKLKLKLNLIRKKPGYTVSRWTKVILLQLVIYKAPNNDNSESLVTMDGCTVRYVVKQAALRKSLWKLNDYFWRFCSVICAKNWRYTFCFSCIFTRARLQCSSSSCDACLQYNLVIL